jgi:hypothetical protein
MFRSFGAVIRTVPSAHGARRIIDDLGHQSSSTPLPDALPPV